MKSGRTASAVGGSLLFWIHGFFGSSEKVRIRVTMTVADATSVLAELRKGSRTRKRSARGTQADVWNEA